MNLRFVLRRGEKVLQYAITEPIEEWKTDPYADHTQYKVITGHRTTWHDIPLCNEESGETIGEENEL